MKPVEWSDGTWTNEPVSVAVEGSDLVVEAVESSDAWRTTSYGFIHESEHALVAPLPAEGAVEVDVDPASLREQFDQAGIFLRQDDEHWIKAGLEFADGALQLGAVVTWPLSDWSVSPVPDWDTGIVTVRASRAGDAVTIRARHGEAPWRLVRVIPVPPAATLTAGPLLAAPTRAGLRVRFTGWRAGPPDDSLH